MLAHQYSKAENEKKALFYLHLSAGKAINNFAHNEVINYFKQALSFYNKQEQTNEVKRTKIGVILAMFVAWVNIGFPEESLKYFQEGEKLAIEIEDDYNRAFMANCVDWYFILSGRALPEAAQDHIEATYQLALKIGDQSLICSAANTLCSLYMYFLNENQKSMEVAKQALGITINFPTLPLWGETQRSDLYARYSTLLCLTGQYEEAEEIFKQNLKDAKLADNLYRLAIVEMQYGVFHSFKGEGKKSLDHTQNAIDICNEIKDTRQLQFLGENLCVCYLMIGKLEKALEYAETRVNKPDNYTHTPTVTDLTSLSQIHYYLGNNKEALHYAEKSLPFLQKTEWNFTLARAEAVFALAIGRNDASRFDEAEKLMLKAIDRMRASDYRSEYAVFIVSLGEFYADTSQWEKSLQTLAKAEPLLKDLKLSFNLAGCYQTRHRYYKYHGNQAKAGEYLIKAIDILKGLEAYGWVDRYEKELAELA
ncbi:hypothetical protein KKI24_08685 [bacterium]|nr:hypothetical protein [bacterium]